MLVLAPGPSGAVGINLDSGAFVRATFPPATALVPFDVAVGPAHDAEPEELNPPEALPMRSAPRRVGRLPRRRAERYLRPLLHPRSGPLLGFNGPAIRYWALAHDRPSVALVEPQTVPQVVRTAGGLRCHFGWRGRLESLPFTTSRPRLPSRRLLGKARVLVLLGPPQEGYCYKLVAGVLPKP
jgi:hypothetical protein